MADLSYAASSPYANPYAMPAITFTGVTPHQMVGISGLQPSSECPPSRFARVTRWTVRPVRQVTAAVATNVVSGWISGYITGCLATLNRHL
jgi:hypothetical protein